MTRTVSIVMALLLAACSTGSGSSATSSSGSSGSACVPGQTVSCACVAGGQGAQSCNLQGSGFDACQCPGSSSASTGSGGSSSGASTGTPIGSTGTSGSTIGTRSTSSSSGSSGFTGSSTGASSLGSSAGSTTGIGGTGCSLGSPSQSAQPCPAGLVCGLDLGAQVESCAALSYATPGDGTVTDQVTGLLWEQGIGPGLPDAGYYDWDPSAASPTSAQFYCASLSLAGASWRLPTLSELFSLIDDLSVPPLIDSDVFPGTPPTVFWSSTIWDAFGTDYPMWIDFNAPEAVYGGTTPSVTAAVRCVATP